MKAIKFVLMYGLLALGLVSLPGYARDPGPCHDDIQKFCKDVKPGGGAIARCLKAHEAELSPACKAKGTEKKEKAADFREACRGDIHKFCKDAKRGHGGVAMCLKEHESELSAECKAKLPEKRS